MEFISVLKFQMTPLKVWLHTALGCNHQSFHSPVTSPPTISCGVAVMWCGIHVVWQSCGVAGNHVVWQTTSIRVTISRKTRPKNPKSCKPWRFECAMNCIGSGFPHRITFKLCTLAYKCLHEQAPDYLTRSCVPVQPFVVDHVWGQRRLGNCWPPPSIQKHSAVEASHSPVQRHGTLSQTISSRCSMSQFFTFKKHLKTHFFKIA